MSGAGPMKVEAVTPDQVKAARALLGWSITRLSAHSDTSYEVVRTFERTGRITYIKGPNRVQMIDAIAAIRTILEEAGVEFTDEDAPGVRLKK